MEDSMIEGLYSQHHRSEQSGGRRLGQAFLEEKRGRLLAAWIGQGQDVLDLGCRDGALTRHFVDGNRVVGGDIDSDALERARRAWGIETRRLNLNTALPFPDERFDVVVLAETLEHLPYPRLTLTEVGRVLKQGGRLIGSAPLAFHLHGRWRVLRGKPFDSDPTHLQYFSYDSLLRLLGEFFTVDEVVPLKGKFALYSMHLFARDVAFRCRKR